MVRSLASKMRSPRDKGKRDGIGGEEWRAYADGEGHDAEGGGLVFDRGGVLWTATLGEFMRGVALDLEGRQQRSEGDGREARSGAHNACASQVPLAPDEGGEPHRRQGEGHDQ